MLRSEESQCLGTHQKRIYLTEKIKNNLQTSSLKEHYKKISFKNVIKPGEPKPVSLDLQNLTEDFKKTDMWQHIQTEEGLIVPLFEFLKRVDNQSMKKDKKQKSRMPAIHMTKSRLETKLTEKFNQLCKEDNLTREEAEEIIKKNKDFESYRGLNDELAEVVLKDAVAELKSSNLLIRSVKKSDIFMKHKHEFEKCGFKLPKNKDGEHDLVQILLIGDIIHINIFEVKRPITYPWDSSDDKRDPGGACVGAINQLDKAYDFLRGILMDIPADKIKIQLFAAFPDTPESILKPCFMTQGTTCDNCYNFVLSQDDIHCSHKLRKKLNLPNKGVDTCKEASKHKVNTNVQSTETGTELLAITCSRLVGLTSTLHISSREPKAVEGRQTDRVEEIIKEVDDEVCVILSPEQRSFIDQFNPDYCPRHVTLQGGPGSGKTLLLLQLIRKLYIAIQEGNKCHDNETGLGSMEDTAEVTDPVIFVTTAYRPRTDPIMEYLKEKTQDMGATVDGFIDLLHEFACEDEQPKDMFDRHECRFMDCSCDEWNNEHEKNCPMFAISMKDISNSDWGDMRSRMRLNNKSKMSLMRKWKNNTLPSMISKLCWLLSKKHPNQTVVIAFDEVWAENAWKKDGILDWSILEKLPENVHLLLVFNPAQSLPLLLPSDDVFLKLTGNIRYRSTRSIIKLTDFMMKASSIADLPEDEIASDVAGDCVRWIDLGQIRDTEDLDEAIKKAVAYLGPGDITFLTEHERFHCSIKAVRKIAKELQTQCYEYTHFHRFLKSHSSPHSLDAWTVMEWPRFHGQETNRVVYLGSGASLEPLSRARVKMVVVLFWGLSCWLDNFHFTGYERNDPNDHISYEKFQPLYDEAEKCGLVEKLCLQKKSEKTENESEASKKSGKL